MDDRLIKIFKEGSLSAALSKILTCLFLLYILLTTFSYFEPQLFQDWYTKSLKSFGLMNLSVENAYLYSVDPIRNVVMRMFKLDWVYGMWRFNISLYLLVGILVFLIFRRKILSHQSILDQITFTFLILLNISFIRLNHGSQNVSVLLGVAFFLAWQTLVLYFPHYKKVFSALLIMPSLCNLLLFPLSLYGALTYYKREGSLLDKALAGLLILGSLFLPFWHKSFLLSKDYFYFLGNPVELSSYLNFSESALSLKYNVIGLIGAMGKVAFPVGMRQFYLNLSTPDILGLCFVLILIFYPCYRLYRDKETQKSQIILLLFLVVTSLIWPLVYRNIYVHDKISSFHTTATVFYQGMNSDDLIAFYILSFFPLFLYASKLKTLSRLTTLFFLVAQVYFVGSMAPHLFKTESYLKSQLTYERDHEVLNLAYLFYANESKDSERINQNRTYKYKVITDRSKNEKIRMLGIFLFGSLLPKDHPLNHYQLEVKYLEDAGFHPWLMLDIYLYYQHYTKLKDAEYRFINNEKMSSFLRTKAKDFALIKKNHTYWESLFFLGEESMLKKEKDDAINFFILSFYYAQNKKQKNKSLRSLALLTEIPIEDLVKSKLGNNE
jgi:hypothetical protein